MKVIPSQIAWRERMFKARWDLLNDRFDEAMHEYETCLRMAKLSRACEDSTCTLGCTVWTQRIDAVNRIMQHISNQ